MLCVTTSPIVTAGGRIHYPFQAENEHQDRRATVAARTRANDKTTLTITSTAIITVQQKNLPQHRTLLPYIHPKPRHKKYQSVSH